MEYFRLARTVRTYSTDYNYKRICSFVDWFRRTAFDLPGRTKSVEFWFVERSAGDVEFSEVGFGFVFSDDILSTDEIGDVIVFGSQAKEIIELLMGGQSSRVVREYRRTDGTANKYLPVGVEGADVPGFKFDVVTKDCGLSRRLYVA